MLENQKQILGYLENSEEIQEIQENLRNSVNSKTFLENSNKI